MFLWKKDLTGFCLKVLIFLMMICPSSFAGKGDFDSISQWILKHELFQCLNALDLGRLSQTCPEFQALSVDQLKKLKKLKARHEIEKLVGPLVKLEKGSYIMGPGPGEPNPWYNERVMFIEIPHDFYMGEWPVRQDQYKEVMGPKSLNELERYANYRPNRSRWISPGRPVVYLTQSEENEYIRRLNERIEALWAVAYQDEPNENKLLRFRKPTEAEREYATTEPLASPEEVTFEGRRVQITARHTLYPGAETEAQLPPQRRWKDGPWSVTDPSLTTSRGRIRGLTRNVWERTSTRYSQDPTQPGTGSNVVIRGGAWGNNSESVRSASRYDYRPVGRSEAVGLRLMAELP